jgi:VWFA-related protein
MVLAAFPVLGQEAVIPQPQTKLPYKIDFNPREDVQQFDQQKSGENKLMLKVHFLISPVEGVPPEPGKNYKVVIEEDGKFVKEVDIPRPKRSDDLAVVLTMDISGSMNEHGRMIQARRASGVFFKSLPAKADCGLILFNHNPEFVKVPPPADRNQLRKIIEEATPSGGTAYLDATLKAIDLLKPSIFHKKGKAVVLMTDGVDINSDVEIEQVIATAKKEKVRIYTIGIGEPGKQDKVTTIMVLDKSGSMNLPANDQDKNSKIQALRFAADRFVNSIGSTRRTTIIEFSDSVQNPPPFTNNKYALKGAIKTITAKGETALFDAVYTAVATLDAEGADGKRAVVALTDGIDNMSRRRVDEVIARAKEAKIPLFMLGFGRQGEIDVKTMTEMANQTGGKFYHAESEQKLLQLFENLSIQLHDDGIDEASLRKLAIETEGKYYSAKNLENLDFILKEVTQKIQATPYNLTFPSLRQVNDGTFRLVSLKLMRSSKEGNFEVVEEKTGGYQRKGLVIAEMNPMVYLPLLGILIGLVALPAMLKRRAKTT